MSVSFGDLPDDALLTGATSGEEVHVRVVDEEMRSGGKRKRCVLKCCAGTALVLIVAVVSVLCNLGSLTSMVLGGVSLEFDSVEISDGNSSFLSRLHPHSLLRSATPNGTHILGLRASCRVSAELPVKVELRTGNLELMHHGNRIGLLEPVSSEIVLDPQDAGHFHVDAAVAVTNMSSFHNFSSELLNSDEVFWDLVAPQGITVLIDLPTLGQITISGVSLTKSIKMKGCAGLTNTSLQVWELSDRGIQASGLDVYLVVDLYNPSSVRIPNLGYVFFNFSALGYPGVTLGHLNTTQPLMISQGVNQLVARGRFTGSGSAADSVIGDFLRGADSIIVARAPPEHASTDFMFSNFLAGFEVSCLLHGMAHGVVRAGLLDLSLELIAEILALPLGYKGPLELTTQIKLFNPFQAVLLLKGVHLQVVVNNSLVGTSDHDNLDVVVPRNGTGWTKRSGASHVTMKIKVSERTVSIIKLLLSKIISDGYAEMGLLGNFTMVAGGLTFHPPYKQLASVPACIRILPHAACGNPPDLDTTTVTAETSQPLGRVNLSLPLGPIGRASTPES